MIEGNQHILSETAQAIAMDIADRAKGRANSASGIVPPTEYLDYLLGKDPKGVTYDNEETLLEAHTPPSLPDFRIFHPGRILAAVRDFFWAPTSEEMHND